MNWFIQNKEWLFSGLGVVVIGWLLNSSRKKKQVQKSGDNSINVQVGGDFKINQKLPDE